MEFETIDAMVRCYRLNTLPPPVFHNTPGREVQSLVTQMLRVPGSERPSLSELRSVFEDFSTVYGRDLGLKRADPAASSPKRFEPRSGRSQMVLSAVPRPASNNDVFARTFKISRERSRFVHRPLTGKRVNSSLGALKNELELAETKAKVERTLIERSVQRGLNQVPLPGAFPRPGMPCSPSSGPSYLIQRPEEEEGEGRRGEGRGGSGSWFKIRAVALKRGFLREVFEGNV